PAPGDPAHDHEILVALALDLDPVVAALRPGPVRRIETLGHEALELLALAQLVERRAVPLEVIERAQQTRTLHGLEQKLLSGLERQITQIARAEREQIEHHVDHGDLRLCQQYLVRALSVDARLKTLKVRYPALVEGDDFAIEHQPLRRERGDGARD